MTLPRSLLVGLLDISASITTLNLTRQLASVGKAFPQPWVQDAQGNPSTDPDERGLACKRAALAQGVPLSEGIASGLRVWADKHGVAMPARIS
jgi:LDH2 family malate/lactate/ureidoglycolate dehydrogenase